MNFRKLLIGFGGLTFLEGIYFSSLFLETNILALTIIIFGMIINSYLIYSQFKKIRRYF